MAQRTVRARLGKFRTARPAQVAEQPAVLLTIELLGHVQIALSLDDARQMVVATLTALADHDDELALEVLERHFLPDEEG